MKTIGDQIRTIRKKLNMDAEEFGEQIGVLRGAVYKYENNKSEPSIHQLITIAKLGDMTIDGLITGNELKEDVETFGGRKLSPDEHEILTLFRKLDAREYGSAMRALELIVETSKYPIKEKAED